MGNYMRPTVTVDDSLAEGVFLASGDAANGCDSIYIKGVYHPSDYSDWENGTNLNGRGCEGCPANNGASCSFVTHPEWMNYEGDFRPSWEVAGKDPNAKYNQ